MRNAETSGRTVRLRQLKSDNRGSAIVIVIIAMAMIGILASTIVWASYLNYRIKISDLKVKNSFYSAETVVEQILAGVKKDVVSASVNEAYQEVVSNWDALATDANRESYFITAYTKAVEEKLGVAGGQYKKDVLKGFVDAAFWEEPTGGAATTATGYIVNKPWDDAVPTFKSFTENRLTDPTSGTMTIKNICVEFYDSDGLLSVINTDIAIDVPKLQFTQAGTIDRLYPYVLVGDDGVVTEDTASVKIDGSIYGGAYEEDGTDAAKLADGKDGIQIGKNSHVTVENANYIISGGDIVVGNAANFVNLINQDAELVVRDLISDGVGFRTNVYAQGLAVNGSHLDIAGKVFASNDLILSGMGSNVSLAGQYFGYGSQMGNTMKGDAKNPDGTDKVDDEGNPVQENVNPAQASSAIVINGKDSTVDLTKLTTLQLAGRAYVSLTDNEEESGLPHVLMGESISVKSNQIAYLVPPECVGTLDGRTIVGQNPVSFSTWSEMMKSLPDYQADGRDFRIVNADIGTAKLGGGKLNQYGIGDIRAEDFDGVDPENSPELMKTLNAKAAAKGIRFLYMPEKQQVYLYLVMDASNAERYFTAYYNVNSNKASLDAYFNTYASGGIRLKENVQGYTVVGNSMVSLTDAGSQDEIRTNADGDKLVRLLSSVKPAEDGDGEEEDTEGAGTGGEEEPADPDAYTDVSDNLTDTENVKTQAELDKLIANCGTVYENLNRNLMEENDPSAHAGTVFENIVQLEDPAPGADGTMEHQGLKSYLAGLTGRKAEFGEEGKVEAVLVDGDYAVTGHSDLRLVIATGDVSVEQNFQGLILAGGTITVKPGCTVCMKDGEGVYSALQAKRLGDDADTNVPANVLVGGSGMVLNGYEGVETDELGNLAIDYSEIVRYENWIKK